MSSKPLEQTFRKMEEDLTHIPAIEKSLFNIEADIPAINQSIDRLQAIARRMDQKFDLMIADARSMRETIARIEAKWERVYGASSQDSRIGD